MSVLLSRVFHMNDVIIHCMNILQLVHSQLTIQNFGWLAENEKMCNCHFLFLTNKRCNQVFQKHFQSFFVLTMSVLPVNWWMDATWMDPSCFDYTNQASLYNSVSADKSN